MKDPVIRKLLTLNREFYQTFAENFSATRMRLQPGVLKILNSVPRQFNILDVGCGNGELARWLAEKRHKGVYLGLDFSSDLLTIARDSLENRVRGSSGVREQEEELGSFTFLQTDLSSQSWDLQVHEFLGEVLNVRWFDLVFAFATLHHIPGAKIRLRTLQKIHHLLHEDGHLIHSNWQFLNSERLRKRVQPWSMVDLEPDEVDQGDYLLDWRQGGYGLRYVHHFSPDELVSLASATGFEVIDSFYSDGEGGNLGLYQIWQKTH